MKNKNCAPNFTIAVTHISSGIILFLISLFFTDMHFSTITANILLLLVIAAVLKLLAKEMHFYAYAKTDVANVTVFSALIPIFGIIFGLLFLGEEFNSLELAGIIIVCISIYGFFLNNKNGKGLSKTIFSPFLAIKSLPILCAFLSTIPPALAAVFMKQGAIAISPLYFALFSSLLVGFMALFIELMMSRGKEIKVQLHFLAGRDLLLIGFIFGITQWTYITALTMENIAHTMALQRLSIILQMVLAYFLLGETSNLRRRLIFGLYIFLGAILIEYGR